MSWASKRQTTRIEDEAYCLLGIFGVNMPLLYGEGEQAFARLQQEITKESDDQTIFAWGVSDMIPGFASGRGIQGGVLAPSPKSFAGSGHIVRSQTAEIYAPYAATNKGLQISLLIFRADTTTSILVPSTNLNRAIIPSLTLTTASNGHIAVLNCHPAGENDKRIGIYIEEKREYGSYVRVNYRDGMALVPLQEAKEKATHADLLIQLQNRVTRSLTMQIDQANRPVLIQPFTRLASEFKLKATKPEGIWQHPATGGLSSTSLDFSSPYDQKPCALEYANANGHGFVLILTVRFALGKLIGLEGCIAENVRMAKDEPKFRRQVRNATTTYQRNRSQLIQKSSHGLLKVTVKVTEARHASIVNLDARKVTLGPPPVSVSDHYSQKGPVINIETSR